MEQTPRPRSRRTPDLTGIFDSIDQKEKPAAPAAPNKEKELLDVATLVPPAAAEEQEQSVEAAAAEGERLVVPPGLQAYLSPDLWRKLNSGDLRQGVLVNALDRTRSVVYLLSTFLPAMLVREKMNRPSAQDSGQFLTGSVLFADVSGFTALSERLAVLGPEGAERLTQIMNRYFVTMLEILAWSGGILLKFAGDAMLVYFPEMEDGKHVSWATRAALRMLRAMSEFSSIETPVERVALRMKIGVGSGEFLAASVGSKERKEYIVLGTAISLALGGEGNAAAGQLVVDQDSAACLESGFEIKPQAGGYVLVTPRAEEALGDFEIRAEKRRGRGAAPWDASPQFILNQIKIALEQIEALKPFLPVELVERVVAHAQQRGVDSEFRPTTVLFCNFQVSERLQARLGRAGVKRYVALLNAYFKAMHEAISRHGGVVTRIDPYTKGSKLLVLFGAPVAHEDDPLRAVNAALEMNLKLAEIEANCRQELGRYLSADFDEALIQHRIGITFGETFAGLVGSNTRREYTVMGDDVNLSARLMGAAKPGEILLSQRVYDVVSDYFVISALKPIQVKGKSKRIAVYQVDGPRESMLEARIHTPEALIGRATELAQAEGVFQAVLDGNCRYLSFVGPAGIGKSHLADELIRRALERGARGLFLQCRSYLANAPYACWREFLRSLAGITSLDHALVCQEKFWRLVESAGLQAGHVSPLANLMGFKPGEIKSSSVNSRVQNEATQAWLDGFKRGGGMRSGSKLSILQRLESDEPEVLGQSEKGWTATLDALETLFTWLLAQKPAVLFFEDAHWMDAASRDLLYALYERLSGRRLLVILNKRNEDREHPAPGETIFIEPLEERSTFEMVASLLLSNLGEIIHEQTRGNPLYVDEITRWIQRTWNISIADVQRSLQESNVFQKMVLSDLESLPEAQREVARVASVIGNEFRIGELHALLAQQVDPVSLSNYLRDLIRARFVVLVEAGVDARYAFVQGLVRDILYHSIPFERRRDLHGALAGYLSHPAGQRKALHRRIAAFLEQDVTADLVEQVEQIVFHYEQAGQWVPAAQQCRVAAGQTWQQGDVERTLGFYQHGLTDLERVAPGELGPDVLLLKAELLVGRGDIVCRQGDYTEAAAAYEQAVRIVQDGEKSARTGAWLLRLALLLPLQGRNEEAINLVYTAQMAHGLGDDLDAAAILAWLYARSGHAGKAAALERARQLLPVEHQSWHLGLLAMLDDLSEEWRLAVEEYRHAALPAGSALAAVHLGDAAVQAGRLDEAYIRYEQAAQVWQELPTEAAGLALARYRQAEMHWHAKRLAQAATALQEANTLILSCPPVFRVGSLTSIQNALKLVQANTGTAVWPGWRSQYYEDTFYISLLFHW